MTRFHRTTCIERTVTRTLIEYNINVNDDGNSLQIIFLFSLRDADITITDKNGNVLVNKQQSTIYDGKTLYIYAPKAYPYTVEITSPTLDVTGEIVLEEI